MVHLEQRSLHYMGFWVFHLILAGWTGDFSAGNGRQCYHSHIVLPKSIISLTEIKTKWNLIKVFSCDGLIRKSSSHTYTMTSDSNFKMQSISIYTIIFQGCFALVEWPGFADKTYSKNQRLATPKGKAMEERLQVVFLSCTKTFKVAKHLRLVNDSHLTRVAGRAEIL